LSTVELLVPEAWLVVDDDAERIVDIAAYLCSGSAAEIPYRVPDLIFEIVSPSPADRRRDYEEKRAEFERIGVKEYVIVDRFRHRLTVLRLADGSYQETVLSPSDTYTTPLLPGLEIPLVEVL
jgi:Uma2 family endonuclease